MFVSRLVLSLFDDTSGALRGVHGAHCAAAKLGENGSSYPKVLMSRDSLVLDSPRLSP